MSSFAKFAKTDGEINKKILCRIVVLVCFVFSPLFGLCEKQKYWDKGMFPQSVAVFLFYYPSR